LRFTSPAIGETRAEDILRRCAAVLSSGERVSLVENIEAACMTSRVAL
jgi:hypothetical protein